MVSYIIFQELQFAETLCWFCIRNVVCQLMTLGLGF